MEWKEVLYDTNDGYSIVVNREERRKGIELLVRGPLSFHVVEYTVRIFKWENVIMPILNSITCRNAM